MIKQDLENFGRRVNEFRTRLGYSTEDFAETIKISPDFLQQVESGEKPADMHFFHNITKYFNVDLHYILHGGGDVFGQREIKLNIDFEDFGEEKQRVKQMYVYMRYSPLVKYAMLQHFVSYTYEHEEHIKKDLDNADIDPTPIT